MILKLNILFRSNVAAEFSCKYDQEPEVQHHHLHPPRAVQPVQVLPEPLLPHHGLQSVHSSSQEIRTFIKVFVCFFVQLLNFHCFCLFSIFIF